MRRAVPCALLALACACGRPFLARDGTLVFPEKGAHGASAVGGGGPDRRALCWAALGQLAGRDRVVVVDAAGPHVVVPAMPASNRSLVLAAIERRLAAAPAAPTRRARAVATALAATTRG